MKTINIHHFFQATAVKEVLGDRQDDQINTKPFCPKKNSNNILNK